MKDKLIQIRADAEFLSKLEYLQMINGFKNISETIRKAVEKEYRKEKNSTQKRGEWVIRSPKPFFLCKCSVCGETEEYESKFCPNCGAKMK